MKEDFVTYEQAVKLKELGFDWKCDHWHHWDNWCGSCYSGVYENHNMFEKGISVPTLAQVQKWLREVKGVDISIDHVYHRLDTGDKVMYGLHVGNQSTFKTEFYLNYDGYEQALSAGIDKALKLLKENRKWKIM